MVLQQREVPDRFRFRAAMTPVSEFLYIKSDRHTAGRPCAWYLLHFQVM